MVRQLRPRVADGVPVKSEIPQPKRQKTKKGGVKTSSAEAPYFPFFKLPPELRKQIFGHLLPQGLAVHPQCTNKNSERDGSLWTRYEDEEHQPMANVRVETSLFLVCKTFSNEARAILYGCNTFTFCINTESHSNRGKSLQSLQIFGVFGTPDRLHQLRDLRSIDIAVLLTERTHWAAKRLRARLDYFITILKEHSDDEIKKSLLKSLMVSYQLKRTNHHGRTDISYPQAMFRFAFESLAALRGIENAHIVMRWYADLPSWFCQCLLVCLEGKGAGPLPLDYPEILVEKKTKLQRGMFSQTTRTWYQPIYDWGEYAERNGIKIPEDWAELDGESDAEWDTESEG